MGFLFGGDTNQSQESITDARKRLALAMVQRGADTSPIASPWQGAARLVDAVMGGYDMYKQEEKEKADNAQGLALGISALTGQPYTPPAAPEKPAGFLSSIFGGNKANPGATGSDMPKVDASGNIPPATVKPGGLPEVSDYIRQAAVARGIDPNIALRVAGHEGLNVFDPSQPDRGGDEGSSFGPFQLHYAGMSKSMPNSGLGNEFTNATGLHARDPSTWKQQVDFALDWARNHGWGPWMGAKAEGITGKMGIGDLPPQQAASAAPPVPVSAPPVSPIQPPPVNPPPAAPVPGYQDPQVTTAGRPDASPMPTQPAPNEVASLDPSVGIPMPGAAGQMRASDPAQVMPPQAGPQAALPPLPTSTVGPTPNVASVPPVSQIPPEFQGSQQLMNADPKKGIMPALLGGSPASPEQIAQAQQSGPARLASALDNAPQPAQNPMANPRVQALVQAISSPNVPPQLKAMAAQQLQILTKPPEFGFETLPDGTILRSDPRTGTVQPVYQTKPKPVEVNGRLVNPDGTVVYEAPMSAADQARIKVEQDKLDYERNKPTEVNGRLVGPDGKVIADFGNGDWEKGENGVIFNKKTGERIAPQSAGGGGFRFSGNSVEAQSLNGLIDSGQITPDQAQQLGAGKTITGPNGEIVFMTPQGVFGTPAGGGTPRPLNAPQASQGEPIDLFGDGGSAASPVSPPAAPMAPVVAPPAAAPPAGPETAPMSPAAQNSGVIPITAPKAATNEQLNAAGFADRMHSAGALLDKYEQQGLNATDQFLTGSSLIPSVIGNGIVGKTNPDYQLFDQARRDFINAQLRRESGAVIGPDEFNNANKQYFPQPGDGPKVILQKREARKLAIESMGRSAGPNYTRPKTDVEGSPRPRAKNPQTGETIEFDGTQWVPVK